MLMMEFIKYAVFIVITLQIVGILKFACVTSELAYAGGSLFILFCCSFFLIGYLGAVIQINDMRTTLILAGITIACYFIHQLNIERGMGGDGNNMYSLAGMSCNTVLYFFIF